MGLQRALSAYFYFVKGGNGVHEKSSHLWTFARYFKRVKGAAVRQLAGQTGMECHVPSWQCREPSILLPNVTVAMHRFTHGFKFVCLADFYNLSVCLFHSVFPRPCREYEFFNNNPGSLHSDHASRAALSNLSSADIVDEFDQPLWEAAKRTFWADVWKHTLTPESCARLCGQPETSFAFK